MRGEGPAGCGCSPWAVRTSEATLLEKEGQYETRLGIDLRLFTFSLSLSHLSIHLLVYLYIYNINLEKSIAPDSSQYDNLAVPILMV